MMVIRRDKWLNCLLEKRGNGQIKVVTGVRRCGKSFLLFKLFRDKLLEIGVPEKHIITVALDDDVFAKFCDVDLLSDYLRSRITDSREIFYVLLDEVQFAISREELKNHDKPVRLYALLNGLLRLGNVEIYVTGSNSKLLSKDVLTEFRGRGDNVELSPLSFREFSDYVQQDMVSAFEDFAIYGGLPAVLLQKSEEDKVRYLRQLLEEVYFKDIAERYDLKRSDVTDALTDVLCSSVGSLTNVSKLVRTIESNMRIKVSDPTISAYLEHLTDVFLFRRAKRFDVKGKRYFEYPSKFYCVDTGLRNVKLNMRQNEETHLMENILFNELVSRGFSVDVGVVNLQEKQESGHRSTNPFEIDFVVNKGSKKFYIQSALNLESPDKARQELRPLLATKDFFKKIVVTKSLAKPWYDDNGILRVGLYDFLLDEAILEY